MDVFGSDSPACEIEFFELIHDMMAALGATPEMWVLRANDRVLLDAMLTALVGIDTGSVREVAALVDRWEKYDTDALAADAAEIGVTDKQFARLSEVLSAGLAVLEEIPEEPKERSQLMRVLETTARELITFDPMIVRGFDYYTSTVFEVFDTHPDNRRSLFGGGRYDNLVGLYSTHRIPGLGFGMGDVTLFDFLTTHSLLPAPRHEVDAVVIPTETELSDAARGVARSLRDAGVRTITPLDSRKLGKEIQRADKAGARVVVIVRPEDWPAGYVTVRNLITSDQQRCSLDATPSAVSKLLTTAG